MLGAHRYSFNTDFPQSRAASAKRHHDVGGQAGVRHLKMTAAKVRLAMAAMGQKETKVADLCDELGITRQALYRHVAPDGALRKDGQKVVEGGQVRNRNVKKR